MKKICVLLNGSIVSDSRVIREIKTMSRVACVDLFYVGGNVTDKNIFNDNVRLFSCDKKENLLTKIVKHSCFYNEFMFYVPLVLKQGIIYDYIWANDLPDLKPALKLKKKLGSKVIYDSHEIYIETIQQFFPIKAKWNKIILHRMALFLMKLLGNIAERKMLKHIDFFVTVNQSLKLYFENKYNFQEIKVIMNCPNIQNIENVQDLRKQFNIPKESKIVIFQGVLNQGRALFEMIDAMYYVNKNIYMLILGNGPMQIDLNKKVEERNLQSKIFLVSAVPSKYLLSYTKGADFGINLIESTNLSKYYSLANKLFEYTHSGIPTIASDVPENRLVIKKYDLGLLVNNSPKEIAIAINKMADMDLSKYKENCREAAKEYNWENQEKVILEIIEGK